MTVPPVPAGTAMPPARPRPGTVTAAAVVMFLLSLVSLGWAGVIVLGYAAISDQELRDQVTQTQSGDVPGEQLDTMVSLARGLGYGIGAFVAVLAIVLAVLAVLVLRGSRVARVLTWVTAGFYLLCGLCSVGSVGLGAASGLEGGGAAILIPLLPLAGAIATIILLALPASNQYFAKPAPGVPTPPAAGPPPAAQAPVSRPAEAGSEDEEQPQIGLGEPPARPWSPPPTDDTVSGRRPDTE